MSVNVEMLRILHTAYHDGIAIGFFHEIEKVFFAFDQLIFGNCLQSMQILVPAKEIGEY